MTCRHCQGVARMFDEKMARRQLRHYRRKGPGKGTRELVGAVAGEGVEGLTFLDVGGGVGAIQHELMVRGASGGTSADASPGYLAVAREEAEARGYAGRIRYVEGDFVERAGEVDAADLVTLDRVVCCYPDMAALVGAAARLTRRSLGLVIPRGTWVIRSGVAIVNLFQRLRRHPFRVYVHDPGEVEAVVGEYGLRRWYMREGLVWRVAVYGRGEDGRGRQP
ncbi:MAG: methyltransferase domain-containing protein [Gemmatimonadota bacterium]|nr:methyltransferase domain-containing protein [Gemmatimonadota bacterium]